MNKTSFAPLMHSLHPSTKIPVWGELPSDNRIFRTTSITLSELDDEPLGLDLKHVSKPPQKYPQGPVVV